MTGYNMPDGCNECDIPGWNDDMHSWTQDCSHCDGPNEVEGEVDSRYGGEIDWTCEHCGEEFTASIDIRAEREYRADLEREYWDSRL